MSDLAISVHNLTKLYRIGQREQQHETLIGALASVVTQPFNNWRQIKQLTRFSRDTDQSADTLWALRDVSFDVKHGEVVGIIGRNGSGKSTLLKILSRITLPTSGRIVLNGRVASMLEVGTGFHPDLTGRENVYLNGTLLGMSKHEVVRKFDEIVAFAEVEKFIDTPIKRYSSGMTVRLAFAVAAHLEPEILLVDEVITVGDIAFQKKSLEKMREVSGEGRTILLVSHQLNQIRRLCSHSLWLNDGQGQRLGQTSEVVSEYEAAMVAGLTPENGLEGDATSRPKLRFIGWNIDAPKTQHSHVLDTFEACSIKFTVEVNRPIRNGFHTIGLWNYDEQLIWGWGCHQVELDVGQHELVYQFPSLPLRPGGYHWEVVMYEEGQLLDRWLGVPEMNVATIPTGHPNDKWSGLLNFLFDFKIVSM